LRSFPNIFLLIFLGAFSACEDAGTGFEGGKIEKEQNISASDGTDEKDAEAVPPEMISGAFLVCQWIDESQGQGSCSLVNESGLKIDRIVTETNWWTIVERDGGTQVNTDFQTQLSSENYHVKFTTPPELIQNKEQLDVIMTYPWGYKNYNMNRFFEPTETATVGREGTSVFTALRDLTIPQKNLAKTDEAHRYFHMWPDPILARADLSQNAYIVSSVGSIKYDNSSLRFDPSAYCSPGGQVKKAIDPEWETNLTDITNAGLFGAPTGVRSEIKRMDIVINLTSGSHCVVPLKTGNLAKTGVSSDGSCLFMILRDSFSKPEDRFEPQPYLAIFSKKFADAVGFDHNDMEAAAEQFQCTGLKP